MKEIYSRLILKAQENLLEHPFDVGHNIFHHYEVYKNCWKIVVAEKLIDKVDLDVLLTAAWWHDYDRGSSDHPMFVGEANKLGLENEKIEAILRLLNNHSFDKIQDNLEEKIIFDADKIEYFNISRWSYVNDNISKEIINDKVYKKYAEVINTNTKEVIKRINFEYSKARVFEELKLFIMYVENLDQKNTLNQNIKLDFLKNLL